MTQEVEGMLRGGSIGAMAARDISHEAIIALVHDRPEIWDPECTGYSDRVMKRLKWEEVYRFLTPNWENMSASEQENRGKEISTRWRSLRDRYKKELNEERSADRSGAPATRRRPNPHAEALSFLRRTTEMRPTVSSVPARARRASISSDNELEAEANQERNEEPVAPNDNQPPTQAPVANIDSRVQSTSTTRRTRRVQQEPPFEEYFNRLLEEMKSLPQTSASKDNDEFLNISDPDVMFCRMLLSVIREVPPHKRTEVKGDLYAYIMFIVSACKEQRPFPRFQPWGLGFTTPSGSVNKSPTTHRYHDTTPTMSRYSGPPPMYTPFLPHQGSERMHAQPNPCCPPSSLSSRSDSPIDVGSEQSHSSMYSPYPVYENL